MTSLSNVTLVCVDTVKYGDAITAIQECLKKITPFETLFFTDIDFPADYYKTIKIPHLYSKQDYSSYMLKELGKYPFQTSHILVIQWDGFVLDDNAWTDEYLDYDYIGAPWMYIDGRNVGNGGFSLRSVELHKILALDSHIQDIHPEDNTICREYRHYLQNNYSFKFASDELAAKFSFELHEPTQSTFGFHGHFHHPWKEPVVLKRSGGMGDVVAMEPVMEYFYKKGYRVIVDSPYPNLFSNHYFKVEEYEKFNKAIKHRMIDLDNAYEVKPKQLHLKSYFEICGITDYVLRNPKLIWHVDEATMLFKKYIVVHIDKRDTTHRNVNGIAWSQVVKHIEKKGYQVIQIGKADHEEIGTYYNTVNYLFLQWVIKGSSGFIGVDSGPANIAVALGIPSVIFFGSVNPEYIYHDLSKIICLQEHCPINEQHCWHFQPGQRGRECPVDKNVPPCTVLSYGDVIDAFDKMLEL